MKLVSMQTAKLFNTMLGTKGVDRAHQMLILQKYAITNLDRMRYRFDNMHRISHMGPLEDFNPGGHNFFCSCPFPFPFPRIKIILSMSISKELQQHTTTLIILISQHKHVYDHNL